MTANFSQNRVFLGYGQFSRLDAYAQRFRVKLSKSRPKTSKYLQRLKNNSELWSKLRFSRLWSGFDAGCGMDSVSRAKLA
jgi:hypothetical protein